MNSPTGSEAQRAKIDWLGLIRAYGRFVLIVAVLVAAIVAVAGYAYLRWGQSTQTVASLEFRPTFFGLTEMEYPNGLPFSPNDVTAGSVIDKVYDANNLSGVCDREVFRGGFYVEQRSDQSVFLDLEYQARLTEPRITAVERKLLADEHAAKRKALPLQYRLVFVAPPSCSGLTQVVITKAMVDTLAAWASESETQRGVLNLQVEVLTPGTLDVKVDGPGGLLLRADVLRTTLQRIVRNIEDVADLPGASIVRSSPGKVTFAEIRGKIMNLMGSRLDPLVMTSGRLMASGSNHWVIETVAAAERRRLAAEQKVKNYHLALQAYSGTPEPVAPVRTRAAPAGSPPATNAQPGQMPSLDDSFIQRIVDLSDSNIRYRQKLTDAMVDAQIEAVAEGERANYYRRLLESAGGRGGDPAEGADLEARLDAIVQEGKKLTQEFNNLYDEFSRVALRASSSLYEARKPVTFETSQQYARRSLMNLVLLAFAGAAVLTFGFFAVRSRLRPEHR